MTSLIVIITFILLLLTSFIVTLLFIYQNKQISYIQNLEEIKANFDKTLLTTNLEIREETFQNISREIHDNINLTLTLAKLNLNTLDWTDIDATINKVNSTIELLSRSISELSDISKSVNSDIIIQQGLISAFEYEISRIHRTDLCKIDFNVVGSPKFLDEKMELIIFRIVQEAFNNILKHANATFVELILHFKESILEIKIEDNGKGFDTSILHNKRQSGLKNMQYRINMLKGLMSIESMPHIGTHLSFLIPYNQYE